MAPHRREERGVTTVSAIVPTYNRADTLPRALTSIFDQTRVPDEIIVVDDGSTDGTADVVRRFPQARLVRLDANGGAARARNAGVRLARGTLIAFLDSDDAWSPRKLERQLARMVQANAPALLCTGVLVHLPDGRAPIVATGPQHPPATWSFEEFQNYAFATSSWLIARDALLALGLFDEKLPNCEDLDLLARMSGRYAIEVLPEQLTVKYNRPDSLDANLVRTAESYAILFSRHRELWARAPAALSRSYQRLANMHIRAGDMPKGRLALARAAMNLPWRLSNWALYMLSLLGRSAYLKVRRLRANLAPRA